MERRSIIDSWSESFVWRCEKWSEEAVEFCRRKLEQRGEILVAPAGIGSDILRRLVGEPEEAVTIEGNLLMNAGIQRMEDNLITVPAATAVLDNTHARLGVGNSATAEAATQTDLQAAAGAANRQFKMMNAGSPTRASQTLSFIADFLTGEANFIWNEWCIDNGTASGTTVTAPMFNRKVASLGTKASGTWTLTGQVTLS
jgi:hypothetical protein